jgi:hypothetical protein
MKRVTTAKALLQLVHREAIVTYAAYHVSFVGKISKFFRLARRTAIKVGLYRAVHLYDEKSNVGARNRHSIKQRGFFGQSGCIDNQGWADGFDGQIRRLRSASGGKEQKGETGNMNKYRRQILFNINFY